MIKFGFNTLAMITYGLGIRIPWGQFQRVPRKPKVEFRDKPPGIAVEEKTGPVSFEDESIRVEDK